MYYLQKQFYLRKEILKPLSTSPNLNKVLKKLRSKVSFLKGDRVLNQDLQNASKMIRNGELIKAVGIDIFPTLESI